MRDGRLRKLSHSEKYSLVAAVFSTLFPDDFDRVRCAGGLWGERGGLMLDLGLAGPVFIELARNTWHAPTHCPLICVMPPRRPAPLLARSCPCSTTASATCSCAAGESTRMRIAPVPQPLAAQHLSLWVAHLLTLRLPQGPQCTHQHALCPVLQGQGHGSAGEC
jgi:hypothetical protein